jgi:3-deoxy-D-manno-octulosonic-acid transferase
LIGANPERTSVTGNIKFDFQPPVGIEEQGRGWRAQNAPGRRIWVAGSTHDGEETIVLDAHRRILAKFPDALLVLVPRHPQRFEHVRDLLVKRHERAAYRSSRTPIPPTTSVLLGDTMGELMMFYAAADVAFVAGSLAPIGGHNVLEPASLGRPVLTGPHNFNGEEMAQMLMDAGAALIVSDAEQLAHAVMGLFADANLCAVMGAAGKAALDANRGALERLMTLVDPLLE